MDKVACIIPAAGQGKRMGNQVNKQFLLLSGLPILVHTLRAFDAIPEVNEIILVCRGEEIDYCKEMVESFGIIKVKRFVAGGKERQDSVWAGLQAVSENMEIVLVHDGARPFIDRATILRGIEQAKKCGAVVVGVPVKDTIKMVEGGGRISSTPPRDKLWQIQTPQIFKKDLIYGAYKRGISDKFNGTDDASFVEYIGGDVFVALGTYENIKITTPEDLYLGEAILQRRVDDESR